MAHNGKMFFFHSLNFAEIQSNLFRNYLFEQILIGYNIDGVFIKLRWKINYNIKIVYLKQETSLNYLKCPCSSIQSDDTKQQINIQSGFNIIKT